MILSTTLSTSATSFCKDAACATVPSETMPAACASCLEPPSTFTDDVCIFIIIFFKIDLIEFIETARLLNSPGYSFMSAAVRS